MKKSNKGFSMVELIIVIAIMAILAGALAPALIKYINKSRLSTDIQTGQTIATAIQTALSNEAAFEDSSDCSGKKVDELTGSSFKAEVLAGLGGGSAPTGKSNKDSAGTKITDKNFYVEIKTSSSTVKVYYSKAGNDDYMVYPTVGKLMTAK